MGQVRSYTRKSKSGKLVKVRSYTKGGSSKSKGFKVSINKNSTRPKRRMRTTQTLPTMGANNYLRSSTSAPLTAAQKNFLFGK